MDYNGADELNGSVSRLREKAGQETPFEVPDGYFDTLPARIQERIAAQRRNEPRTGWYMTVLSGWRAVAIPATVLALLVVAVLLFKPSGVTDGALQSLTWEELIHNEPGFIYSVEEETIINWLVAEMDASEVYPEVNGSLEFDPSIGKEDIIEYLYNEEISNGMFYEL